MNVELVVVRSVCVCLLYITSCTRGKAVLRAPLLEGAWAAFPSSSRELLSQPLSDTEKSAHVLIEYLYFFTLVSLVFTASMPSYVWRTQKPSSHLTTHTHTLGWFNFEYPLHCTSFGEYTITASWPSLMFNYPKPGYRFLVNLLANENCIGMDTSDIAFYAENRKLILPSLH